jgi:hypothetical protein
MNNLHHSVSRDEIAYMASCLVLLSILWASAI